MLSEADALAIAADYATRYYARHGTDYRLRLDAVLHDPPGFHFTAEYPSPLRITGDAGFFVSRIDGTVVQLGTGAFPHRWSDGRPPTEEQRLTMLAEAIRQHNESERHAPPN